MYVYMYDYIVYMGGVLIMYSLCSIVACKCICSEMTDFFSKQKLAYSYVHVAVDVCVKKIVL